MINDKAPLIPRGCQHLISEHVTGVVTTLHDGNMSHNVTMIRDNISIFSSPCSLFSSQLHRRQFVMGEPQ